MQSLAQLLLLTESSLHSKIMGLRSSIKRKILGIVFDSITESFYDYVKHNPDCRLCEASAAVLPSNYGKRSRLFASHVMDDLVRTERVVKYKKLGTNYPRFVVNAYAK